MLYSSTDDDGDDFSGFSSKEVIQLQSTNPTDDGCPCNQANSSSALLIQCSNQSCQNTWHASCAGFTKPTKNIIKAIVDWVCPVCVVQKLSISTKYDDKSLEVKLDSVIDVISTK